MALSFIKKVFTFGKPAEEPVPAAVERELEPRSRDEDLPVADDPVLAEEMDTAGGPAADIDEGGVEAAVAEDDVESSILPAADQLNHRRAVHTARCASKHCADAVVGAVLADAARSMVGTSSLSMLDGSRAVDQRMRRSVSTPPRPARQFGCRGLTRRRDAMTTVTHFGYAEVGAPTVAGGSG
jgi:hypothetical protein